MNIKGKLIEVFEAKQLTSTFRKREFVIEYAENAQYPQYIKFELLQDNCDLIDKFAIGTEIEVFFDLRGKPWTNKGGEKTYFTSLNAWKITKSSEGNEENEKKGDDFLDDFIDPGDKSDLPF